MTPSSTDGAAGARTASPRWLPDAIATLCAVIVFGAGFWRPAPWVDEAATLSAARRSWSNLLNLFGGADAPLVPFYAVEKVVYLGLNTVLTGWVALRLVSIIAAVLTVVVLRRWLTAEFGRPIGAAAAAMFVVFAATSRYGQEARPYAIEMLVSVWCWREWHRTQIVDDATGRWRYSLSIVVLALGHVLGLVQVVGQLVAAIALRTPLRRMAVPAGVALVVAVPWAVLSAVRGTGPVQIPVPYTIPHIAATFLGMITANNRGWLAGLIIVTLAALGAAHLLRNARTLAIMAVCWAAVAPVLLVLLAVAEPATLQRRYWLSSLPGWTILTGAGVVYISRLAARRFAVVIAHIVAVSAVLVVAVVQLPTQLTIRGPGGHGDDIRPVVAAVESPRYRTLPITFGEFSGPLVLTQYAPALTSRVLDWQLPTTGAAVWPNHEPTRAVVRALQHDQRVLVVLRDADLGMRPLSRRGLRELLHKQVPNAVRTSGFDRFRALSQRSSWVLLLAVR